MEKKLINGYIYTHDWRMRDRTRIKSLTVTSYVIHPSDGVIDAIVNDMCKEDVPFMIIFAEDTEGYSCTLKTESPEAFTEIMGDYGMTIQV